MRVILHRRMLAALLAGAALSLPPALTRAEVPRPAIPEARGEQCVEPTDVMRKEHFKFILHQRDETVHRGIRTTKHAFKECIACHVRPDQQGQYPRASSEEHFCSSCHSYAAVTIDCFDCHADRPETALQMGAGGFRSSDLHRPVMALDDHARDVHQGVQR